MTDIYLRMLYYKDIKLELCKKNLLERKEREANY